MNLAFYAYTALLVIVLVVFIVCCFIATIKDNKNKEPTNKESETFDDYCIKLYGKPYDELSTDEKKGAEIAYVH